MRFFRRDRRVFKLGSLEYKKEGVASVDWRDPYRLALSVGWPVFFAGLILVYLVVNLFFAWLYTLGPGTIANARPGSFGDHFFFSVETLATVGYGVMAPATLYGHTVSSIEIMVGLILTAVTTGLIFVRFSRPRSRIIFADVAVIERAREPPVLTIRIGNGSDSPLLKVSAKLTLLILNRDPNADIVRRLVDMRLERSEMAFFALTWSLIHIIGPDSPLAGLDEAELRELDARLYLSITAHDRAIGRDVYDGRHYDLDRIRFGHRYRNVIHRDTHNRVTADLTSLSLTEREG